MKDGKKHCGVCVCSECGASLVHGFTDVTLGERLCRVCHPTDAPSTFNNGGGSDGGERKREEAQSKTMKDMEAT